NNRKWSVKNNRKWSVENNRMWRVENRIIMWITASSPK
ncbi:hypothetical protein AVEN_210641-1, partial [Araneus ventricosus]